MLSMPIQSNNYQWTEQDKKILVRFYDNKDLKKRCIKKNARPKKQKRIHGVLYEFYLFLITVPPMTRGVYTCYYKLDGFNRSLFRLHIHTMPAWLLWGIVVISELVFLSMALNTVRLIIRLKRRALYLSF